MSFDKFDQKADDLGKLKKKIKALKNKLYFVPYSQQFNIFFFFLHFQNFVIFILHAKHFNILCLRFRL